MTADITMNNPRPLWKAEEVAQFLSLGVKTVHKLVREKKLACVQITAKERRFTHEQVQEYIRSQSPEYTLTREPPGTYNRPPRKGVTTENEAKRLGYRRRVYSIS